MAQNPSTYYPTIYNSDYVVPENKTNDSKFILSCIPDVMSYRIKRAKDVPNLFEGLKYYEMKVNKTDYNLDDGHFNIQGHRKYAAFLHRIMKSKTN
jgi:hypothetical protein